MVMMNIWTLICLVRRPSRGRNRSVPLILEQGSSWTLNIHFQIPFQTFSFSFLFLPLLSYLCRGKLFTLNVRFIIKFLFFSIPISVNTFGYLYQTQCLSLRNWEFITYFWEIYTFPNVYMLQPKITGKCIIPILCNQRNKVYNSQFLMHKFIKAQDPFS